MRILLLTFVFSFSLSQTIIGQAEITNPLDGSGVNIPQTFITSPSCDAAHPRLELVVGDPLIPDGDGNASVITISTSTTIDFNSLGLPACQMIEVTPICYNRQAARDLIDNMYNGILFSMPCCDINIISDFCAIFQNVGLNSGSDFNDLNNAFDLAVSLMGTDELGVDVLGQLMDQINDAVLTGLPTECGGGTGNDITYDLGNTLSFDLCNILPIDLVSFTGTASSVGNILRWQTATEINNDYFIIEQSTDGINFERLAIIDGAGTSVAPLDYSYIHQKPISALMYYRLVDVNFDGDMNYSDIIFVNGVDDKTKFTIAPNPSTGLSKIIIHSETNAETKIKFHDSMGKLLFSEKLQIQEGYNKFNLDMSSYPSGIYFIQTKMNGTHETKKIIKY